MKIYLERFSAIFVCAMLSVSFAMADEPAAPAEAPKEPEPQQQVAVAYDRTVTANVDQWQSSGIYLDAGDVATITVPDHIVEGASEPQKWGVIDPKNRGVTPYWGGGVVAGEKFFLPNVDGTNPEIMEGALLARLVQQGSEAVPSVVAFANTRREVVFVGPGEIQFIANDTVFCRMGRRRFECRAYYQAKGTGYADNTGDLTVNISVLKKSAQTPTP